MFESILIKLGYNPIRKCSSCQNAEGFIMDSGLQVDIMQIKQFGNYEIWENGKYVKTVDIKGKHLKQYIKSQIV